MYKEDDILIVGKELKTFDGCYTSRQDERGFSYWYRNDGIMVGSISFDYFFIMKDISETIKLAIRVLNACLLYENMKYIDDVVK